MSIAITKELLADLSCEAFEHTEWDDRAMTVDPFTILALVEHIRSLQAALAQQPAPVASEYPHEAMDLAAASRYSVQPSDTGWHTFAVKAGDGTQELYRGSQSDCENVARKLAGAFLDGGIVANEMLATAPAAPVAVGQEPDGHSEAWPKAGDRCLCPACCRHRRDASAPPAAEQPECSGCRALSAEIIALRTGKTFCGACCDGCHSCEVEESAPAAAEQPGTVKVPGELRKAVYVLSESGPRFKLTIGFDTLEDMQAAHALLAGGDKP